MYILVFLLIGLIAGWAAGKLVEGHGFGTLGDIVVGIIGALIGGFVFSLFGIEGYGFWGSIATSIIGAVVFLFIVGLFTGSHRTPKVSH